MGEQVVVLDRRRPLRFLDDVCAALAEAVSETPETEPEYEELAAVYGEVVGAYARLLREELSRVPETSQVWLNIVDHLLMRLREVRSRERLMKVVEIADQLHGRVQGVTTPIV